MNKTLFTSLIRLIRTTKTRFFAVMAIVTIGVAFFVGVSGTSKIMAGSVDKYDDATKLKDITVYSSYGFDDDDITAMNRQDDVILAEGTRFTDIIAVCGKDARVTRVHMYDRDAEINRIILKEGRWPQNDHEALAEHGTELSPGFEIGDVVSVTMPGGERNENLVSDTLTVVGSVDTPVYLNLMKENSTLSNRNISTYLYVAPEAFDMDYYTEMNIITAEGASFNSFTDAYDEYSAEVRDRLKSYASVHENDRLNRIKEEAEEQYQDGLKKYQEGLEEFNKKIADGESELADAEAQIRDGEQQLADGEQQIIDAQNTLNRETADALRQIQEALDELNSGKKTLEEKKKDFEKQKQELLATVKQLEDAIEQLKAAKDGLRQIDEGLVQAQDGYDQLTDPKVVLLMNILRRMDQDMTVEQLKEYIERLKEISDTVHEYVPQIDEISIGEVTSYINEMTQQIRADQEYAASEEYMLLKEQLQLLDPQLASDDESITSLEGYDTFLDFVQRWDPLTQPETVSDLLVMADNAQERLSYASQILENEEVAEFLVIVELLDDEETVSEIINLDTEQMDELLGQLSEASGRQINTVGDLVTAYDDTVAMLEDTIEELQDMRAQVIDGLQEAGTDEFHIDDKIAEFQDLISQIRNGIADGERQIREAEEQISSGYAQISDAQTQLSILTAEGRRQIAEGIAEIASNRAKLNDARNKLKEGYEELAKGKAEGLEELNDAYAKLMDARKEIDALEPGKWTVLDRTSHYASATFRATVDQMKAIGDIFPLFFILVAALVCLTTMSRLVSELRSETGALRALGYTRMQCAMKYLIYAALATVSGSFIGAFVGFYSFPGIIYNVWTMMYVLPQISLDIPWVLILKTSAAFTVAMLGVTWYVCSSDMKEVPAQLLRPKAPKIGRRTLIERITFIWNRLTFTWKVTVRNLFRYRNRFIMTVLGVAGCCALLVTGFGVSDSVNGMIRLQFDEVFKYEGTISLRDTITQEQTDELAAKLLARDDVKDVIRQYSFNSSAHAKGDEGLKETVDVNIYINEEDIHELYNLRTRKGHKPLKLSDDGVIISEKMSENMDIGIGDTFIIEDPDGNEKEVYVTDICEMYTYHHAYMTKAYYEKAFGKLPNAQTFAVKVNGDEEVSRALQADIAAMDGVSALNFYDEILNNFRTMVKSLDLIVAVIIISSMSLAFVVLGNLININISERQREIATLKVLGFRRREVQSYIYKENNLLTIIGALCGLPVGNLLEHYIMNLVEMEYVMFGRSIDWDSYAMAAGMTILFGLIVNLFMAKNLDRIQMVESLKSVE